MEGGRDEDGHLAGRQRSEQGGEHAWRVESVGRVAAVERRPAFRPLIILGAGRADDGKALWSTHQGEPLARGRLNVSGQVLNNELAGEDAESLADGGSHLCSLRQARSVARLMTQ